MTSLDVPDPVEGLDEPMRDEELFQLYGYVRVLMTAPFKGKALAAVQEDFDDGALSDCVPGPGARSDGDWSAAGFPGPGGLAADAPVCGNSSGADSQGGGPAPAGRP